METGLFEIEADHMIAAGQAQIRLPPPAREVVYALFRADGRGNHGTAATTLPKTFTRADSPGSHSLEEEEPAADPQPAPCPMFAAAGQPAHLPARPAQPL